MPTMNRFANRYGHTQSSRPCSTEGCSGTAQGITARCSRCRHNNSRFGHPLQTLPTTA
jgi:hypothetical protein